MHMSTWLIILLGTAGVLFLGLLLFILIRYWRLRRFRPNPDKAAQQEQLNRDLALAGFAYDRQSDTFYSLMDCWQRKMGYCRLYDEAAPGFSMIMDCEPIRFEYGGKRWLIELWKGQYGITTGAEIGVYNTSREDVRSAKFTGTFYESASDAERLPLSFVLYRNGKPLLKRKGLHWWLTGFRLGEYSTLRSLTMDARIGFPNREMCRAFVGGLREAGYQPGEFAVRGRSVRIHFGSPHTPQSLSPVQEAAVQKINESNCKLFETATARYTDTLDKLEYVKAAVPELYTFFLHSLYARGLYEAFGWLLDEIRGDAPSPSPLPPSPCPDPASPANPPSVCLPTGCVLLRVLPDAPDCLLACPVPCPPTPPSGCDNGCPCPPTPPCCERSGCPPRGNGCRNRRPCGHRTQGNGCCGCEPPRSGG